MRSSRAQGHTAIRGRAWSLKSTCSTGPEVGHWQPDFSAEKKKSVSRLSASKCSQTAFNQRGLCFRQDSEKCSSLKRHYKRQSEQTLWKLRRYSTRNIRVLKCPRGLKKKKKKQSVPGDPTTKHFHFSPVFIAEGGEDGETCYLKLLGFHNYPGVLKVHAINTFIHLKEWQLVR
jgi:hypothetical protein